MIIVLLHVCFIVQQDKVRLEEVRQQAHKKMHQALQSALTNSSNDDQRGIIIASDDVTNKVIDQSLLKLESRKNFGNAVEEDYKSIKTMNKTIKNVEETNQEKEISHEEEMKKRTEHLRQQRDKIIQMKQKERTEKISKYLIKEREKMKNQSRPKTARRSDEGEKNGKEREENESMNSQTNNRELLAYRKTLAARLKAEVVGK